jgi:hypothetical protein
MISLETVSGINLDLLAVSHPKSYASNGYLLAKMPLKVKLDYG